MIKQTGQKEAIRLAVDKLKTVDLDYRCRLLGFQTPKNGVISIRMFGQDYFLHTDDFCLELAEYNTPAKMTDHVLLLRYLLCDVPVEVNAEYISLRDLPGGQFYWNPFVSRTTQPLCRIIGNDVERLIFNLKKFDYEKVDLTGFAVSIHAIGNIHITLVYSSGDEEFPPSANLLFDSCIKRAYSTEDIVVLGSRICLNLIH